MEEKSPLNQAVMDSVTRELAESGGGYVTGYIMVASVVNLDGTSGLYVLAAPDQLTITSLGMTAYAEEWFRDDARIQINSLMDGDE
jgi:hypothetical protein